MNAPRCFVGNFEFEHTLADEQFSLPPKLSRLNAELACSLLPLMSDGDQLWLPEPIEEAFFAELQEAGFPRVVPVTDRAQVLSGTRLVPWGWTADLRRWQAALGTSVELPTGEAVRSANARGTAFQREQELGMGLSNAARVTSIEEFAQAMTVLLLETDQWVVKAEFSMSARERIRGQGEPDEPTFNWLSRRLRRQGAVYLEPWVDTVSEVGLQWTIDPHGEIHLEGIAQLLTNAQGQYVGSTMPGDGDLQKEWATAVKAGRETAEHLQRLGYSGPLGIDAMRYRTADGERVRRLQDINARLTMGRCALGWQRFAEPGESVTWRHFLWPGDSLAENETHWNQWCDTVPQSARMFLVSPMKVGERLASRGQAVIFHCKR